MHLQDKGDIYPFEEVFPIQDVLMSTQGHNQSAYELERVLTINKNNDYLSSLGLGTKGKETDACTQHPVRAVTWKDVLNAREVETKYKRRCKLRELYYTRLTRSQKHYVSQSATHHRDPFYVYYRNKLKMETLEHAQVGDMNSVAYENTECTGNPTEDATSQDASEVCKLLDWGDDDEHDSDWESDGKSEDHESGEDDGYEGAVAAITIRSTKRRSTSATNAKTAQHNTHARAKLTYGRVVTNDNSDLYISSTKCVVCQRPSPLDTCNLCTTTHEM